MTCKDMVSYGSLLHCTYIAMIWYDSNIRDMTQFYVSWLIDILYSYLLSMSAKGSPCAPTTCSANVAATAWNSSSSLMYICVYTCMYMYIRTRTHKYCIFICVCVFVYVHVRMFGQFHAALMSPLLLNIQVCPWCMYMYTWIWIYMYTNVCT